MMSTQILEVAEAMCDRVAIIRARNDSRLRHDGRAAAQRRSGTEGLKQILLRSPGNAARELVEVLNA